MVTTDELIIIIDEISVARRIFVRLEHLSVDLYILCVCVCAYVYDCT